MTYIAATTRQAAEVLKKHMAEILGEALDATNRRLTDEWAAAPASVQDSLCVTWADTLLTAAIAALPATYG